MNFSKTGVLVFLGFTVIVAGCSNRERVTKESSFDQLYFDYSITGEQENENVTCVAQYKYGDEEGKAVNIEPAKIELDGEAIEMDSAKFSGFFYEMQKPIDSFAGKHTLAFITPDKNYSNEFEFSPFTLQEDLAEKIRRRPFIIHLKNFPSTEKSVRLILLDTAFESEGFNDKVPVVDGKVNIDNFILSSVKKGPVILELYLEQEVPLKQRTSAGGKISITYGLKKQFELTD